jgi:hypothetical protein
MRHVLLQIAASTGLLLLVGLWPREGHPVLPALPPGGDVGQAFGGEGWRIQPARQDRAVPPANPDAPGADRPARASGALFAVAAPPVAGCAPPAGRR